MDIQWSNELETGIEEIDNHHKEMLRRFNDFQTACYLEKGLDKLSDQLAFLGDYVKCHLAMEEQLQIDHNYPGYLKHKEEHDGFIRDFREFENQLNIKGTTSNLLILTNFKLVIWLAQHFNWMDKDLATFLEATPNQHR
jgi:hemerythrin-like metal-binding protein